MSSEEIKQFENSKNERRIILIDVGQKVFIPVENSDKWQLCSEGLLSTKLYTYAEIKDFYTNNAPNGGWKEITNEHFHTVMDPFY